MRLVVFQNFANIDQLRASRKSVSGALHRRRAQLKGFSVLI